MLTRLFSAFAAVVLWSVPAVAQFGAVPEAPAGVPIVLEKSTADSVVERAFGLVVLDVVETPDTFTYQVSGFSDGRRCPLEGIRDISCGNFVWLPSRVTVFKQAFDGPVSGHLARNKVIAVDLESDAAGFANGSIHGVLVMPSAGISQNRRPAFGWYLSRSGKSVSMSLLDVSGDGVADVIYTYRQTMPGGVVVVPHDVWTFAGMAAAKYISSGEKISGVSTSIFEGVPLLRESENRVDRGRFVFRALAAGQPRMLLIERAVFQRGTASPDWEIQAVADLGNGWMEYLSVTGNPTGPAVDSADSVDPVDPESERCLVSDLPPDVPIDARRAFLDVEEICRIADRPYPGTSIPRILPARVWSLFFNGVSLALKGYPVVGSAFLESAAVELMSTGHHFAALVMSGLASTGTAVAVRSACAGADAGGCFTDPGSATEGLLFDEVFQIADSVVSLCRQAMSSAAQSPN
jgi:hypothetical protein